MPLDTKHSVSKGLYRLINAPRDLTPAEPVPWREPPVSLDQAHPRLQALFAEYKEWLEGAIYFAVQYWEGMIGQRTQRGMTRDAAIDDLYGHYVAGPAVTGQLIYTVRQFWLRCDGVNRELPPEQRVPHQVFLLQWVKDEGGHDEWIEVMTGMPYWPIGLDEKGAWV